LKSYLSGNFNSIIKNNLNYLTFKIMKNFAKKSMSNSKKKIDGY